MRLVRLERHTSTFSGSRHHCFDLFSCFVAFLHRTRVYAGKQGPVPARLVCRRCTKPPLTASRACGARLDTQNHFMICMLLIYLCVCLCRTQEEESALPLIKHYFTGPEMGALVGKIMGKRPTELMQASLKGGKGLILPEYNEPGSHGKGG